MLYTVSSEPFVHHYEEINVQQCDAESLMIYFEVCLVNICWSGRYYRTLFICVCACVCAWRQRRCWIEDFVNNSSWMSSSNKHKETQRATSTYKLLVYSTIFTEDCTHLKFWKIMQYDIISKHLKKKNYWHVFILLNFILEVVVIIIK